MSIASWKNQGGFRKHRNVTNINMQIRKDISVYNLSLFPHTSTIFPGSNELEAGTLIYSSDKIYYKTYAGAWEPITAAPGTTASWDLVIGGNDIYYTSGNVGIMTNAPGHPLEVVGNIQTTDLTATSKIIGDIYASNGTSKILENGTNGSDATFTGLASSATTSAALTGAQSTAIVTNTTDIAANGVLIGDNTTALLNNGLNINANTVQGATNTAAIAANGVLIGTNATDIGDNTTALLNNGLNINANTVQGATNTAAIATTVKKTGDQTIDGVKTFNDTISGNINGSAVSITGAQATAISDNTTKLAGIDDGAQVTSPTLVQGAGAVMIGSVNQTIAGTKTFNEVISGSINGYAQALSTGTAQATAITNNTAKLAGIDDDADVTNTANVFSSGAVMTTGDFGPQTIAGVKTFNETINANIGGSANSASTLSPGKNIGGVLFDGSTNIDLPGVNIAGTQNTSGSATSITGAQATDITNNTAAITTNTTKLAGIDDGAQVTSPTLVQGAGAVMIGSVNQTIAGTKTFNEIISGSINGTAQIASILSPGRNIGGYLFNGSQDISLPGVNMTGNQDTSGSAASLSSGTQATAIINNSAKTSFPGFGTTAGTALVGSASVDINNNIFNIAQANTKATINEADIAANGILIGTNTTSINENTGNITTNTAAITDNSTHITTVTALVANNTAAIAPNTTKLAGIEDGANVTNAANGAVMTSGTQTVGGLKTFSSLITCDDISASGTVTLDYVMGPLTSSNLQLDFAGYKLGPVDASCTIRRMAPGVGINGFHTTIKGMDADTNSLGNGGDLIFRMTNYGGYSPGQAGKIKIQNSSGSDIISVRDDYVNIGSLAEAGTGGVQFSNLSSATMNLLNHGDIKFYELSANGQQRIMLVGPDKMAGDSELRLPVGESTYGANYIATMPRYISGATLTSASGVKLGDEEYSHGYYYLDIKSADLAPSDGELYLPKATFVGQMFIFHVRSYFVNGGHVVKCFDAWKSGEGGSPGPSNYVTLAGGGAERICYLISTDASNPGGTPGWGDWRELESTSLSVGSWFPT